MLTGRQRLWAEAAVFGGLWGAVEITVGGFLHLLRVPLCGVLMAAGEAGFLVAVRQISQRRGTVLGVAAVAALVRGLTPVGAFFTPMVGIFAAGALVELSFLLLPGRVLPVVVGSALCPLWSVVQYVLHQLLLFGARIWQLYELAYRGMQRSVGESLAGASLIAPILFLAALGALCGLWGMRLGSLARARLSCVDREAGGER
jgi:hypothetical protein